AADTPGMGPRLGERLVALGHVDAETVEDLLWERHARVVWALLAWERGHFTVTGGVQEALEGVVPVEPALPLSALLLDGLQRAEIFFRVARGLVSCSGFRQLAAGFEVSPQTVARHAARLGRQALLFHEQMRAKKVVAEPLSLDSFVGFTHSQFSPTHFHFALG